MVIDPKAGPLGGIIRAGFQIYIYSESFMVIPFPFLTPSAIVGSLTNDLLIMPHNNIKALTMACDKRWRKEKNVAY